MTQYNTFHSKPSVRLAVLDLPPSPLFLSSRSLLSLILSLIEYFGFSNSSPLFLLRFAFGVSFMTNLGVSSLSLLLAQQPRDINRQP